MNESQDREIQKMVESNNPLLKFVPDEIIEHYE